jgi:Flp pilus assembly pilin Flp
MLSYYVKTSETLKRLWTDRDGVVSFEYLIVAFCIVTAVALVFTASAGSGIGGALNTALANIIAAFNTATSP